jgi:creatinine amidohydrolase
MVTLAGRRWLDGPPTVTLLVPVGSVEQHGPHLPLDTDTRIAVAVADRAAGALGGEAGEVLVAPPVAFGASGEHETFPGTVSIGTDALRTLLVELGRSAGRWACRTVFVNGHGGNSEALRAAVDLLRYEGQDVLAYSCGVPGADAHAGRTETSIMLAIAPDAVRADVIAAGNTAPLAELLPAMRAGSVRAVSPNGVLGDPAGATAEEGEALLGRMVEALVERLS